VNAKSPAFAFLCAGLWQNGQTKNAKTHTPRSQGAKMIDYQGVTYAYSGDDAVLRNVTDHVKKGEFVAVIGHNGSGKSTLAKLTNALFVPSDGKIFVDGLDTSDKKNTLAVRQKAGMVFQNPDNQMVTTIVEEDVAFGPENLGIDPLEIRKRVDEALSAVRMGKYAQSAPNTLSGGQKQRIAIAGILAMLPDVIILDEPTAMLDPAGRKDVFDTVRRLNRERGITVLFITHFMEEAANADRVLVISDGEIVMNGTPASVFREEARLKELGLALPVPVWLSHRLKEAGLPVNDATTDEEIADELCRLYLNT
jgi:energy-coupling factor transport system ATP-binding protein